MCCVWTQFDEIGRLEELEVYQAAMGMAEAVWQAVQPWKYFEKDTVERQLVKAADSVAANLSEGFGRYFYEENRQFCYYSRGSLYETKTWLTKARNRNLLTDEQCDNFVSTINAIGAKLNRYIKSIGAGSVKEDSVEYVYSPMTNDATEGR